MGSIILSSWASIHRVMSSLWRFFVKNYYIIVHVLYYVIDLINGIREKNYIVDQANSSPSFASEYIIWPICDLKNFANLYDRHEMMKFGKESAYKRHLDYSLLIFENYLLRIQSWRKQLLWVDQSPLVPSLKLNTTWNKDKR